LRLVDEALRAACVDGIAFCRVRRCRVAQQRINSVGAVLGAEFFQAALIGCLGDITLGQKLGQFAQAVGKVAGYSSLLVALVRRYSSARKL
jgi:hypothetical protein